jgi:hypothetical protein
MTMNDHDLDWLKTQRPQEETCDPDARERALQTLLEHTRRRTSLTRRWRGPSLRGLAHARAFGIAAAAAAAAVAAVVVLSARDHAARDLVPSTVATQSTVHHRGAVHSRAAVHRHGAVHGGAAHRRGAVRSPLVRLADDVSTSATPAGDATLVARTTTTGGQTVTVYDLYADDGKYFFSPMASGLAGQVSAGHNLAGGLFAREVAAAKQAATGDV